MSLLMDALRKAEADKKQASATTQAPVVAIDETNHDDDINLDDTGGAASKQSTSQARVTVEQDTELALEPLETAPTADKESTTARPDDTEGVTVERRATTPPAQGHVNQQAIAFDHQNAEPILDVDLSATGDRRRVESPGINETVASAHTVFSAGAQGSSRRFIIWGSAIVITIGCAFTAIGIYYFQQRPIAHQIPSPSVAADVEKSPPKVLPSIGPESRPEPLVQTVVRIEPPSDLDPLNAKSTSLNAEVANEPIVREAAAGNFPPYTLPDPSAGEQTPTPGSVERKPDTTTTRSVAIGVRPGEVRIARSTRASDTNDKMKQAYAAFVAGDYVESEELYQSVLHQKPEQRDALLGVAALKLRTGDVADAHRLYREVLKRDPNNPTANAAMFSLESGQGDQITESRLKILLDEGVDVGYIYFSLGNLYARNRRWADAQQSYFKALRNNPTNPDYNYNLAVSLDRIGQRTAAAKYYDAAVSYTNSQRAGFDPAHAIARIQSIAQESSP